jgi:hypothetical protein
MPTRNGEHIVLVKGKSGTIIVLTPEEAVDIANGLLNAAQSAKEPDAGLSETKVAP